MTMPFWKALDGSEHATEAASRTHEAKIPEYVVANRSVAEIRAAISREDLYLADALETIGLACRDARIAARDLKRRPSAAPETATPLAITGPRATEEELLHALKGMAPPKDTDAETGSGSSISTGESRSNPDDEPEERAV
jgi:hypothetical protein